MSVVLALDCRDAQLVNIMEKSGPLEHVLFTLRQVVYIDWLLDGQSKHDKGMSCHALHCLLLELQPGLADYASDLFVHSIHHLVHQLVVALCTLFRLGH